MALSKKLDLLCIGDITVDTFIKLKKADVRCNGDEEDSCELVLPFKQKIPYELSETVKATGNASNVAIGASRLGISAGIMTNLGTDQTGRECLGVLLGEGVSTRYANSHPARQTNHHYILWYENDRTILTRHNGFEYEFPQIEDAPKWIYLTSMGTESEAFYKKLFAYLENNPDSKLAFQPGTKQISMGVNVLLPAYKKADLFICNKEEAERITGKKDGKIEILFESLRDVGLSKTIVITDGPHGAQADDTQKRYFIPLYEGEAIERTGAGDAFSSATLSAIMLGKSLDEALLWGPINSMSVVQYIGAQKGLLKINKLEEYLMKAGKNYKIKIL